MPRDYEDREDFINHYVCPYKASMPGHYDNSNNEYHSEFYEHYNDVAEIEYEEKSLYDLVESQLENINQKLRTSIMAMAIKKEKIKPLSNHSKEYWIESIIRRDGGNYLAVQWMRKKAGWYKPRDPANPSKY